MAQDNILARHIMKSEEKFFLQTILVLRPHSVQKQVASLEICWTQVSIDNSILQIADGLTSHLRYHSSLNRQFLLLIKIEMVSLSKWSLKWFRSQPIWKAESSKSDCVLRWDWIKNEFLKLLREYIDTRKRKIQKLCKARQYAIPVRSSGRSGYLSEPNGISS